MVNKKFVYLDIIIGRLGNYVISNWEKLEPSVLALRKEKSDSTFGAHFQELYAKTIHYLGRN